VHSAKLIFAPGAAWHDIAANERSVLHRLCLHTAILALIPAVCWFYGITEVGWQVGLEPAQKMTVPSALRICVLFYLAMIVGVVALGYMVHWMAETYAAADSSVSRGVTLITYTATPFFLAGLLGLSPNLWFDISIGVLVACYCVYLLYIGVPAVMHVAPERGFLFASALVAVGLVAIVALMAGTAILWDFGAEPTYTY
jgi:hypothetical protein